MKSKAKKKTIVIGINEQLNKPTANISFKRVKTNLTNLIVRRTNEYISVSLTDEEIIQLKTALFKFYGY